MARAQRFETPNAARSQAKWTQYAGSAIGLISYFCRSTEATPLEDEAYRSIKLPVENVQDAFSAAPQRILQSRVNSFEHQLFVTMIAPKAGR